MTEPGSAAIALENVTKRFARRTVLDAVDLDVQTGEIVVIVGRSGSGKSTLLKLIGAIEEASSGLIRVAGHDIGAMREPRRALFRRRQLGFVFQFFNLIPTLSVEENIRLPLALNGLNADATRRIAAIMTELGLEECAGRFPEELSGGEQQRVAIARALVHEPGLVIADEPTGNLDLDTASRVLNVLESSCRDRGTTLLMATHSNEVIGLADRVFGIRNGILEEEAG